MCREEPGGSKLRLEGPLRSLAEQAVELAKPGPLAAAESERAHGGVGALVPSRGAPVAARRARRSSCGGGLAQRHATHASQKGALPRAAGWRRRLQRPAVSRLGAWHSLGRGWSRTRCAHARCGRGNSGGGLFRGRCRCFTAERAASRIGGRCCFARVCCRRTAGPQVAEGAAHSRYGRAGGIPTLVIAQ